MGTEVVQLVLNARCRSLRPVGVPFAEPLALPMGLVSSRVSQCGGVHASDTWAVLRSFPALVFAVPAVKPAPPWKRYGLGAQVAGENQRRMNRKYRFSL